MILFVPCLTSWLLSLFIYIHYMGLLIWSLVTTLNLSLVTTVSEVLGKMFVYFHLALILYPRNFALFWSS